MVMKHRQVRSFDLVEKSKVGTSTDLGGNGECVPGGCGGCNDKDCEGGGVCDDKGYKVGGGGESGGGGAIYMVGDGGCAVVGGDGIGVVDRYLLASLFLPTMLKPTPIYIIYIT
ncbi:conserved hypothetical protein [Ricinus communis]|uniref:Uncharacterized protein n=1 Tax=Ricinus communis TaxID=3988 RepID=B9SJP5_RICCO|nr:conserved hypothetical protein [Ricinus communis]